jgi:hypothetical protein
MSAPGTGGGLQQLGECGYGPLGIRNDQLDASMAAQAKSSSRRNSVQLANVSPGDVCYPNALARSDHRLEQFARLLR